MRSREEETISTSDDESSFDAIQYTKEEVEMKLT